MTFQQLRFQKAQIRQHNQQNQINKKNISVKRAHFPKMSACEHKSIYRQDKTSLKPTNLGLKIKLIKITVTLVHSSLRSVPKTTIQKEATQILLVNYSPLSINLRK